MVALAYEPEPVYPLLVRAAEVLEECGWCQGSYRKTPWGPYCALGALWEAYADDPSITKSECDEAERALKWAIGPAWDLGRPECRIEHWNDDAERTSDEVVALLRQVGMWGQ